jgi:FkbM family methyltransferase
MVLRWLRRKRKKEDKYPIMVKLKSLEKVLSFEVFSPVEKYRIAGYGGEKGFLEYFISTLKDDDVVFDIGASVGLMTVHSAAEVSNGKVVAFEPDPETFRRLKHNVELNNLTNVIYAPWATSDSQGEVALFSDGANGFAPSLREQTNRPGAPKGQVMVPTKVLDDVVAAGELPHPTVLKIDIEGAEILCLRGAIKLIKGELGTKPRLIFLELHPVFLPDFGSTPNEVHDLVLEQGYQVVWEEKRDDQIHYCYESL